MVPKKEKVLTAHFRQNGRMQLAKLSRATGLPVSTLFDRVHKPALLGITRFCALLDFPALGYYTEATILMKAGSGKRELLQEHLLKSPCVNSLLRINNGHDFIAECAFRDLRELEQFTEKLERQYGVRSPDVHLTIEELARERFLSDPELVKHGAE